MSTSVAEKNEYSAVAEEDEETIKRLKVRAELNRQKALLIRKAKIAAHPYIRGGKADATQKKITVVDSNAGFLIEDNEQLESEMVKIIEPAPIITDLPTCKDCQNTFNDSYLLKHFDYSVCDSCWDKDGKHSTITKTEAKKEYLLKDCDFDKREPPLKFILKKNPHVKYGEMKLYLHLQVEERALVVWGSEEKLIQEKEEREVKRERTKVKKFNKKMKELRMQVRSSLYDRTIKDSHRHEFGPETYDEAEDTYSRTCDECGFVKTYEKM